MILRITMWYICVFGHTLFVCEITQIYIILNCRFVNHLPITWTLQLSYYGFNETDMIVYILMSLHYHLIVMIIIKQNIYFRFDFSHIDVSRIISYYVLHDLISSTVLCYTTFHCMLDESAGSLWVWVLYCILWHYTTWFDIMLLLMLMMMIFNLIKLLFDFILLYITLFI